MHYHQYECAMASYTVLNKSLENINLATIQSYFPLTWRVLENMHANITCKCNWLIAKWSVALYTIYNGICGMILTHLVLFLRWTPMRAILACHEPLGRILSEREDQEWTKTGLPPRTLDCLQKNDYEVAKHAVNAPFHTDWNFPHYCLLCYVRETKWSFSTIQVRTNESLQH